jgi:trehalose 6-phosphate phosphatase
MIEFHENAPLLEAFFRKFTPQTTPLLLLDYDGTLAPFRKDRFRAHPWTGVREILAQIQQTNTHIAFITGRPAGEIAPLLGIEGIEVWGLHGAEHLFPDGRHELAQLPEATLKNLAQLRAQLHQDSFGGLFEDKPNAAVMHWRGASPQKAARIREKTLELFTPLASPPDQAGGLKVLEFESGVELRAGPDKGSAVAAILKQFNPESPVAFLGDDITDESAFRAVNKHAKHGISILVRKENRETAANLWLRPPTELKTFLKRWQFAGGVA